MKKVLSFLAVFVVLGTFASQAFAAYSVTAPSGQTIYYLYNSSSQTITLTYPGAHYYNPWLNITKPTGALVIPDSITHNGTKYPVISIGNYAFMNCSGITSVAIPNSVTSIGNQAFYDCGGLTSVTIPNSVTSMGQYAFMYCIGLTSVTIGSGVTTISKQAFYNCSSLTSVSIPNSVTSIVERAFQNCSGLTSVTIGSGVTSIGNYAFQNCTGLDTVYMMPATPPSLGSNAFYGNASGRVFIIAGCGYDNYYNASSWSSYCNSLHRPIININVNVSTANITRGTAAVVLGPDSSVVHCDSTVVIQATAYTGYHFDRWDNNSTNNPDTVTLTGDTTIIAIFERDTYNLTVNVNDTTLGTVATPQGTSALYQDTLMVVATPIEHYHVASWQGQGVIATSADKDTVWVKMLSNRTLTCNFAIDTHTVAATASDIARGSVSGGGNYAYGTPCTVTATAYSGYAFQSWGNGVTANPYTFVVLEDVELSAVFVHEAEMTYTITVSVNDPAMGSATVNGNATASVMSGTEVTLAATPNAGYHFVRWNDDNTNATRTVTVTSDISFTAYFAADTYTVTVSSADPTMGSATVNGNTSATVMSGETVTLTATPNSGYHFVRWDDNNTDNPRTVTVTADMSFTAIFMVDGGTEGIEDIDASNIKVYADDGRIVVEGITDEVRVYDMMGRMITHSSGLTATSPNLGEEQMVFNVPTSGVYLVKVGILPAKKVVVMKR